MTIPIFGDAMWSADLFKCEFDRCSQSGSVYTIMGCLEQHLTERVYCDQHDGVLITLLRHGAEKCHCGSEVILAESIKTYLIHNSQRDKLLRDQQARKVAKLIDMNSIVRNARPTLPPKIYIDRNGRI